MYCPENILVSTKVLWLCHYASTDFVHWGNVPLAQKFNPLRYEIAIWRKQRGGHLFYINEDGRWALKFSNTVFKTKRRLGLVR